MAEQIRSYTSIGGNVRSHLREFRNLAAGARGADPSGEVAELIRTCRAADEAYTRATGRPLQGAKALEIGPGQMLAQMRYFSIKNEVIGIDLDAYAAGFNIPAYWRLLRTNGVKRLIKTVGRQAMGRDRRIINEMKRQLGVDKFGKLRVRQMDAAQMSFPDASFDFVYSFSVFEHLPDPGIVLRDIRRVLKPGGVVYTNLHLYTSDSGSHDLRVIGGRHAGISYWAHLRPAHEHELEAFVYINRKRLAEYREILARELPGSETYGDSETSPVYREELSRARAAGELEEFTDEELLTRNVINVWRKPG